MIFKKNRQNKLYDNNSNFNILKKIWNIHVFDYKKKWNDKLIYFITLIILIHNL